jgi:hypothetical protein
MADPGPFGIGRICGAIPPGAGRCLPDRPAVQESAQSGAKAAPACSCGSPGNSAALTRRGRSPFCEYLAVVINLGSSTRQAQSVPERYLVRGEYGAAEVFLQRCDDTGRAKAVPGDENTFRIRRRVLPHPFTHHPGGLTNHDAELAREISAAALKLAISADPSGVQHVQVTIDALVTAELRPFWRAVLGYQEIGDEDVLDPHRCGPPFTFQQMDAPRSQRNRIHIDVYCLATRLRRASQPL